MIDFNALSRIRINAIVRRFVISDLFLLAGWGFVSPIFAVFVLEQVAGATVVTLGIAAAIYWIVKSVLQPPIAIYLDRTVSESDDYRALVISLVLAGLTAFAFILVYEVWQLYVVEVLHAVSFALYIPSWHGLFARHLDPKHRALEFSLDSTVIGIATGVTGLLGSLVVRLFGFNFLFFLTSLLCFVAAAIIFYSPEIHFPVRRKRHRVIATGDHTPRNIRQ